ncbi:hypothetical protein C5167_008411 [Papaver somniferum]|uniref:MalT-like TPR region domain-containing protein n=1 Tax=Papaver somniferum TaxID=3469 RepID=A0A4Y7JXD9_PAPSO|nr:protein KINESIN LIGHT CHAIN-RELATED 3-like [Papaver somniferum]RZC64722.1 hypothetical protein C5167_008411 [Papaver somniferum]
MYINKEMGELLVDSLDNDIDGDIMVVNKKPNDDDSLEYPKLRICNMSPQSTTSSMRSSSVDGLILAPHNFSKPIHDRVIEMQSLDQFPSRSIFGSDSEESRAESEFQHFVRGEVRRVMVARDDEEEVQKLEEEEDIIQVRVPNKETQSPQVRIPKSQSASQSPRGKPVMRIQKSQSARVRTDSTSDKSSPRSRLSLGRPPTDTSPRTTHAGVPIKQRRKFSVGEVELRQLRNNNNASNTSDEELNDPRVGTRLLKQANELIASQDNPKRALRLALLASKSFEICAKEEPSLQLVASLHLIGAIYCKLGQCDEAIPVLKCSIQILPVMHQGQEQALAKFAGHMQLGDTYAMMGQLENSIECYKMGLQIQKQILGETDPKVGETYRYIAEAHIQALQFDDAEKFCKMALENHRKNGSSSIEEAADRRLMGLILGTKGYHDAALEHLLLASMAMVTNGQEMEVASLDCSIGDSYLSLARYNEAVFAYENSLTMFKTTKGENHTSVASVYVRLAELYNKMGKGRECKFYCENALQIYQNPIAVTSPEEIAIGLTDVSAIYESMNDLEMALELLQKSLMIYEKTHSQLNTTAGIEGQMGVFYYMMGNYTDAHSCLKNATERLRVCGETKSALFGTTLNQMGLTCVRLNLIREAVDLFEEAMQVLKQEYGDYHPETLGVLSNLAATYDAIGRLDDAIRILEYVVCMREEKLGTANTEVDDEKRRLAQLQKESGRAQINKGRSLKALFSTDSDTTENNSIILRRGFSEPRVHWNL